MTKQWIDYNSLNNYLISINLLSEFVFRAFNRSSHQRCSVKKGALRKFTKFTGKNLCQCLFFNKVAGLSPRACNFIKKETLSQVFSCEFYEISKNTFFTEHLLVTASHLTTKLMWNTPRLFDLQKNHVVFYRDDNCMVFPVAKMILNCLISFFSWVSINYESGIIGSAETTHTFLSSLSRTQRKTNFGFV